MCTFLFFKVRSSASRFLGLLIACACWLPSQSQQIQQAKSPLQLADKYFAAGEYYTAAYLYEQYLNPAKSNIKAQVFPVYAKKRKTGTATENRSRADILYKLAESYRFANYWVNADSTYKKCTDKIDALYWRAVCERSLGKYDEAEENIRKYLSAEGTDRQFEEAAEKELQTLQYIRKQLARADSVLVDIRKLHTRDSYEKGAFAVAFVSGNQYLVSSTQTDSVRVKGRNPYNSRLFYATLNNDSLAQLTSVAFPSAGTSDNQGAASISAGSNRIYCTQWRKENGRITSNIYYIIKQSDGSWATPLLLRQVNTNGFNSKQPFCTANGKYLFFASDRPGGSGGFDIWYAPLNEDGSTGNPVNAGSVINTAGDEQAPFYHTSSGTLVFSTNGRLGMGGYDLFSAKGSETTWSVPDNMGHPVNSSRDDIYFFAPEKTALLANAIVGSDRGAGCCIENYRIKKVPKVKRLNGLVRNCRNGEPVADVDIALTDSSGKTRTTKTDIEGKYVFDVSDNAYKDFTITLSKPSFQDTAAAVKIINTVETNLLTDELFNAELCIDKPFVLEVENVVTVFFDFDKSILKPEAVHKLDSIYNILMLLPSASLQISGYTDGKGSVAYNKKLSDRRAKACARYFIKKGINRRRITFKSFGACCPLQMELINGRDNPDGRSRNRRALINISKE